MGGKEARDGFWFQDATALVRLMDDAIERRRRQLLGIEMGPELRVRIESAVELVVEEEGPQPEDAPPRPLWDGTFTTGTMAVVDECKLGGPTRNDRVTFYRRLRATIAAGVPVAHLAPRLTVGRGSTSDAELDSWTDLGETARTAQVPTEPPTGLNTKEKFAAEALYYLTTASPVWKLKKKDTDGQGEREPPPTPALAADDARELLSRFEIDATHTIEDLESKLRDQLVVLGGDLAIDELVVLLGGWIGKLARATDWHDDITAESLNEKLAILARYLSVAPETQRLWHRLRTAQSPLPVSMVVEQPWRDVQPQIEPVIRERATNRRIAFVAEGGVGKSHLLGALRAEQSGLCVWIDAVADVRDLEEAISLGVWASSRNSTAITVFVDAVDHQGDPDRLLARLSQAIGNYDHAAIYVAVRFATWADIRDRLPDWRSVRLGRWDPERVRAIADVGRAEPLSADLIDLLRTPLLLDLFLRTFAAIDTVPAGLATRQGVLRAYFERRILAGSTAAQRRSVLDAGVDAVLANAATWQSTEPAANELLSEGVVVNAFGALRFRHALLRDFSAALRLGLRNASSIADALRTIASPIIRNELLRGTIEALLDPEPIVQGAVFSELVRSCIDADLAPGVALGTTDAPTPELLVAIASLEGGAVLRQALEHAHLLENRAWLRVPGALGGSRPNWLGEAQFQGLARLVELALATGDVASELLATTLRTWTLGRRLHADEGWSAAMIGALLVRAIPDDDTARWFAALSLGETGFRVRFLEQLRDLGSSPHVSNDVLARALQAVVLGDGSHVLDGGHSLWEVTDVCLSEHDGHAGLTTTRPAVALALVFQLSVELRLARSRRRAAAPQDPALAAMFPAFEPSPEFVEAEARLRREPMLTEEQAVGNLVDDAPSSGGRSSGYLESLIDELEQRAATDIAFAEQLAEAGIASRSVDARIIVLSMRHEGQVAAAIDTILRDARIYHLLYASRALWEAIQLRWPHLAPSDRETVRRNVLARAQSPFLSFVAVGRLASAIPQEERGVELQPYVQFLESTARPTAPDRPARMEAITGGDDEDEEEDPLPAGAMLARIEQLSRGENDDATNESIAVLEQSLGELGDATSDRVWYAVARVAERDERRDPAARVLTERSARALFDSALVAIASRRPDVDRWATLLELAAACASYVRDVDALAMRSRLINEVVAGVGDPAENEDHAWRALVAVRPITWFTEGTGGRAVYERWFRNSLHGDALHVAEGWLHFIPGEARLALVSHVLEAPDRLTGPEGSAFADEAGRALAGWSLWWTEANAREYFQQLVSRASRPGVLESAEGWRHFLSGFAWSLQNEVRHVAPDPRAVPGLARYVPLLELVWLAWRTVVDDGAEQSISVGWSVTAALSVEFATAIAPPLGGWSMALRDLLASVIVDGGRLDIAAFQQVQWASVDAATLVVAANATIARAAREITSRPATDWMMDSLIEILARVGVLATLPLDDARRVLDCLQRLGRSAPRANSAAVLVGREVRERESVRTES